MKPKWQAAKIVLMRELSCANQTLNVLCKCHMDKIWKSDSKFEVSSLENISKNDVPTSLLIHTVIENTLN